MTKAVKFVLNRKNFRDQILKSEATAKLLEEAAVVPEGCEAEVQDAGDRVRVRVVDARFGALLREARSGHLSRAIGQIR